MKKILIITILLFFSLTELIIAQVNLSSGVLKILGSGEIVAGESKDFTEEFYETQDLLSFSLSGIEGPDKNFINVTLNSWDQDWITSWVTLDITISLDANAPVGSTLSFTIVYRLSFWGGSGTLRSNWTIKVISGPTVAEFLCRPRSGNAPLNVLFIDMSTGGTTKWNWDFGDGLTSTLHNPLHTYQNSGIYNVSLTVQGSSGSDTEIKYDYITVYTASFGGEKIITTLAEGAQSIYAADLDRDGDQDVLSASLDDAKIAWYENDGTGNFGDQQIITTSANGADCVYAADLNGDGNLDVLSASMIDDKIAWYENDGVGNFGDQQIITTLADRAQSVYAADLDGDGDQDVLSASLDDAKIAWYENDGTGNFGDQQIITTLAEGADCVYAADLDGDGNPDVLSASYTDGKIAWYENDGTGNFSDQQIITTLADGAQSVYAVDLDRDGDQDVLSASMIDDKIAWYENDGTGNFGDQEIITTLADGAYCVYAADLDKDGDPDILSASYTDGKIAWYENDGAGNFGDQEIITTLADGAQSVYAADLDGDGVSDLLSASYTDCKIAWYENLISVADVVATPLMPDGFVLSQNYPNPFNLSTTIRFNIPEASHVIITIYDILGHKVKTLAHGNYQPGSYSEIWDANDDQGLPLTSGTYLVRMQAGKFVMVKKMLLLK